MSAQTLVIGLSLGAVLSVAHAEGENSQEDQQAQDGNTPLLIILPNPVPSRDQANKPAAASNSCGLRTRALDKMACRAALQNHTTARATLRPRIPENNWKAANQQLTSNLEWY